MSHNTHCDSCRKPVYGKYTLVDVYVSPGVLAPPSYLCYDHGKKFDEDARSNGIKYTFIRLGQKQNQAS